MQQDAGHCSNGTAGAGKPPGDALFEPYARNTFRTGSMAERKVEIQPLFAEPYLRAEIGHALGDAEVAFIKNLKMVPNKVNQISENLYILEEPALKGVKAAIQGALDVYAREVMGIKQRLYVTQSWSLVNMPGVGMHGHAHSNSIVSGSLYYTDMPEPAAGMIFDRHRTYQQILLRPDREKNNLYNAPANIIYPTKGDVILFSSSLQHHVETNGSKEPRYSVAFNTFVKGKIGDYRDVSELTL